MFINNIDIIFIYEYNFKYGIDIKKHINIKNIDIKNTNIILNIIMTIKFSLELR